MKDKKSMRLLLLIRKRIPLSLTSGYFHKEKPCVHSNNTSTILNSRIFLSYKNLCPHSLSACKLKQKHFWEI
jgi:hypothetical protein